LAGYTHCFDTRRAIYISHRLGQVLYFRAKNSQSFRDTFGYNKMKMGWNDDEPEDLLTDL